MPRPPLPDPSAIFPPPEVVLVLRFGQPPVLAGAPRDLTTLWLRTVVLAATITEIWKEQLTTMHALAFCVSLHWQTANSAPKIKETLPARSRKSYAHDLKNQPNNTRKKSAVLKLLKKISARPNVIFKPADLHDSQIAAGTLTAPAANVRPLMEQTNGDFPSFTGLFD